MKFRLDSVQATKIDFQSETFSHSLTKTPIVEAFHVDVLSSTKPEKKFGIQFSFTIKNKNGKFILNLEMIAHFITDEIFTKEMIGSDMVLINAPAISFPYIRAFVSNLTLNSGYSPIFLPTYNFVQFAADKRARVDSGSDAQSEPKLIKKISINTKSKH